MRGITKQVPYFNILSVTHHKYFLKNKSKNKYN
jgi:hypothetical protein